MNTHPSVPAPDNQGSANWESITGQVTQVNGSGLQIHGRDGWLNVSRYASPQPLLPRVGEFAQLILDPQGYIRRCRVLGPADRPNPSLPAAVQAPPQGSTNTRDFRLQCLKRAFELAPYLTQVWSGPEDAFAAAESIARWANGETQ